MLNTDGWTKYFTDGTKIFCSDDSNISWRNTKLDALSKVSVQDGICNISISGTGDYWISDDFIVPVSRTGTFVGKRIYRRVEKFITDNDKFYSVEETGNFYHLIFSSIEEQSMKPVPDTWKNQWLVLELDLSKKTFKHFLSKEKI